MRLPSALVLREQVSEQMKHDNRYTDEDDDDDEQAYSRSNRPVWALVDPLLFAMFSFLLSYQYSLVAEWVLQVHHGIVAFHSLFS